jgi:hypothetical protein
MIKTKQATPGEDGLLGSDDLAAGEIATTNKAITSPLQRPRKGGRRPRRKGDQRERSLVRILQAAGFAATRVPLSGSAGGQLYGWIDGADVLVIQGDRQQPLVVVRLRFALDVAVAAERGRR